MFDFDPNSLDAIVRVIQSSLTPIFLLTAIASLLGVFNTRLARISDQVKALAERASTADGDGAARAIAERRLSYLRSRSHMLDAAVILGAVSGACTCGTVLALFLSLLRARATVGILFFLFGIAILCTIGALAAFLTEVLWASRGVRAEVEAHVNQLDR